MFDLTCEITKLPWQHCTSRICFKARLSADQNDFLFSCKQNLFSQERFCTQPRFESERFWNSEMAYPYQPRPQPFQRPFHLRLRPDIFESAYFFFYTNCSSHHTKPVNLDSALQGHLRPGPHDNQIKNTGFQKITGFVCTWPQGRRRSPEARLPFLVGRYCYLLDLTLTSMSTLFRGSS